MSKEIIKKENNGGELAIISKKEFVTKFEPVTMLTSYKHIKTVAQAIQEDKNGISFYSKHLGEDTILAVVELHLLALNQSVNVGQPLTKYQIKEIAIEILSVFYYLSMVEICFVFRKAKRGEYGQLYGVLNIVTILDWFNQYIEQRTGIYIERSTKDIQNDFSQRSAERKEWREHEKRKKQQND
jgi:hypothetical protein